jgi:hypothetical protein
MLDDKEYRVVFIPENVLKYTNEKQEQDSVPEGWYLLDDKDFLTYKIDVPIKRDRQKMDNGEQASEKFKAPQPQLFAIIIRGILGGNLEWFLIVIGVLVAVALELMGVSALPVAVGMYLGLDVATPMFFGGILRWITDRWRGVSASEAETETSPGVLLSSGYIAGGTLCGLIIGFFAMLPKTFNDALNLSPYLVQSWQTEDAKNLIALIAFAVLAVVLLKVGTQKEPITNGGGNGNSGNQGQSSP